VLKRSEVSWRDFFLLFLFCKMSSFICFSKFVILSSTSRRAGRGFLLVSLVSSCGMY
jgi:hypothetical protein